MLAFDPDRAIEAQGEVVQVDGSGVQVRLQRPTPASLLSPMRVKLLQALGKGDKIDRIVRDTTALGVTAIVPVFTERTIPGPAARNSARVQRLRTIAVETARQSGRGDIPAISDAMSLGTVIFDLEPATKLCLDGGACLRLEQALQRWSPADSVVVAVGPEGGWAPTELSLMQEAGFVAVALGPFTLRTELAAAAALATLLSRTGGAGPQPAARSAGVAQRTR